MKTRRLIGINWLRSKSKVRHITDVAGGGQPPLFRNQAHYFIDEDKNQVLINAMMLPKTVNKKQILPELKLNGNQYIEQNQTRRPKKIQKVISGLRSKSPVYTLESEQHLSSNFDVVRVKSRMKSPVAQEAKLPFQEKVEITDFLKFTLNKDFKL